MSRWSGVIPGPRTLAGALTLVVLSSSAALAQYKPLRIPGNVGLQVGTQPPPGIYVGYLLWVYPTDTIKDQNGDRIGEGVGGLTSSLNGAVVSWVTNYTLIGGRVGGTVVLPFIRNRIERNALNIDTGIAYTDTIVSPFTLGWHKPQTDLVAGYSLYLPTGEFEAGGSNNSGLGMYGQELAFGVTQHFDQRRSWHGAANVAYEWHSQKRDLDLRVGQTMTIEGGFGKTFYTKVNNPIPLITNIGIVGYSQFKVTGDTGEDIPPLLRGLKDRVFALGPEVNVYIPQIKMAIAGRVLPEFGARVRTQGTTISISAAYTLRSLARQP